MARIRPNLEDAFVALTKEGSPENDVAAA